MSLFLMNSLNIPSFQLLISSLTSSSSLMEEILTTFPISFILIGFSVLILSIFYSLEPIRLSKRGIGEWIVSYVLTIATPSVGVLIQGGEISTSFIMNLLPLFLLNTVRMMIMNIPDKDGDEKGGKVTSVVMIGEKSTMFLHNLLTMFNYLILIPLILRPTMPPHMMIGYYLALPLRWYVSLRLNSTTKPSCQNEDEKINFDNSSSFLSWWDKQEERDALPYLESMFILSSIVGLCVGEILHFMGLY